MTSRRRFISILPLAGVSLLAACSDKAAPPPAPAAAPAADPAPPPAPAAPPAQATASAAPATAGAGGAMVEPGDAQAVALGYVDDASKVDKAKYPAHADGQACSNCALYQGKAGDAAGPCPLYAGKQVSAKGWCSAYSKKA